MEASAASDVRDLITIGAGPAALSAAIYTTREDIATVLYEKAVPGGLAATTDWVDNYPGFADGIAGLELADSMRRQAERFGAKIELGEVSNIVRSGDRLTVTTTDGEVAAKSVLIATGCDYKRLGIPGEAEYYARGVHYCATCDGAFYRDKRLVIVGGGNSAVQEAIFLTRYTSEITMLVRGDQLRASDILQHELTKHSDKITVRFNTTTDEIVGEHDGTLQRVVAVKGTDKTANQPVTIPTDGVFVFIGLLPNTGFLKHTAVLLDDTGFVISNERLETSIPGVFVAGDCRSGATMQIATAVGEGATAALRIREYLDELNRA